jgi:hypothetical protein
MKSPVECQYSTFNILPVYSAFPSDNYADFLLQNETFRRKFTASSNLTRDRVRTSILKLNVYFSTVNIHKFSEQPEMDAYAMFGSLGGQLGLILGMSLLSLFELLDIFFLIIHSFVKKIWFR